MAGGQERILRRRVRTIQSTRKTTRAMELIAGSRIVRSQQRIVGARPYVDRLEMIAADLAASPSGSRHQLLAPPKEGAAAAIVAVTGDRGLCGAYNSSVIRRVEPMMAANPAHLLVAVGRKAQSHFRHSEIPVEQVFTGFIDRPRYEDARQICDSVLPGFVSGRVATVEVVSMRFVSAGQQVVESRRILPLGARREGVRLDYELEPDLEDLLDALARPVVEAQLYLAMLEASAAFYAAQQRAMKAATDNADDLIKTLRRVMNRARQDAITTEIMDIVGGAEALRQSSEAGAELGETA